MGKLKTHNPTYCIMDNWENMFNLTHTPQIISDRHFTSSMSSDKVCTMMIMRWCNVQTNEYDLQAKTYPTICTHHKLHNTNEKFPVIPECIHNEWQNIWCNKHLRHTPTEKYENNGKGVWYGNRKTIYSGGGGEGGGGVGDTVTACLVILLHLGKDRSLYTSYKASSRTSRRLEGVGPGLQGRLFNLMSSIAGGRLSNYSSKTQRDLRRRYLIVSSD